MSDSNSVHEEYPDYKKPPFDREVNVPLITKLTAGLLGVAIAAFIGMWWMYVGMKNAEAAGDPEPHPFAQELQTWEPPGPQLQFFPPSADIERLKAEEEATLTSYEEEDAGGAKQYRIPLERAIEILSERGLPGEGNVDEVMRDLVDGDRATVATSAQTTTETSQDGEGEEP